MPAHSAIDAVYVDADDGHGEYRLVPIGVPDMKARRRIPDRPAMRTAYCAFFEGKIFLDPPPAYGGTLRVRYYPTVEEV